MQTPICEECAKSGFLCATCEDKLQKGSITRTDINVSRLLYRLESKEVISGVNFVRSLPVGDFVLVVADGKVASLIGKGGRVVRTISEEVGKKVRIVGNGDMKMALRDLVFPARIYGLNVLHTNDGEEYRAVICKEDKSKLVMDESTIKAAIAALFNKNITLTFA
jgi:transcription antitermination factor NusA-like protein